MNPLDPVINIVSPEAMRYFDLFTGCAFLTLVQNRFLQSEISGVPSYN